jgi:hypothetical protein
MGADFMFSRFPRFEMTDERENEFEDTLQDILSDPNEEVEFMDWFMYEADETSAFQEVLGALSLINETADNDREAVAVRDFTEGGFAYVHYTGGISFGDEPTEIFTYFNIAGFFPEIYELALTFAQEDYTMTVLNSSSNGE